MNAALDPAARTVVYTTPVGNGPVTIGYEVLSHDVQTGQETTLGRYTPDNSPASVSITNDGKTVGFQDNVGGKPQFITAAPDGSGRKQITNEPEGVRDAVLSGYGNLAWAITGDARLLRIDMSSLTASEVIPATPAIFGAAYAGPYDGSGNLLTAPSIVAASGSVVVLAGTALTQGDRLRPITLGTRVVEGLPYQRFQVPSDLTPGSYDIHFDSQSPLEQQATLRISDYAPGFMTLNNPPVDAPFPYSFAHGDFSGLATLDKPAHPGEVVIGYMVGLGPVTNATPISVSPGFQCTPGDLLYAGPAPGFAGVYQINIRLPATPAQIPLTSIRCGWGDDSNRGNGYAQAPVR